MPSALDLFCCAGGSGKGLMDAGFDVTGIDIEPQPRYPGRFVQADALRLPFRLDAFDLIWASPPCQAHSVGSRRWRETRDYPDLIAATRDLLAAHPMTIIENVPGAPIRRDLILTGAMFGLETYRRRHFETSFLVMAPDPGRPFGPKTRVGSFTAAGNGGHGPNRPRMWAEKMGVPWMVTKHEIRQAIPPIYAEFISRAALRYFA